MFGRVEFTNMCMLCSGSRVVVIDRKKQDWPGVAFPGGHVEPGESFTDAVIREMQEETGLNIRSPQLCGIKDWCEDQCRYVVLFYKTTQFEGELRSSSEGKVWWEDTASLPDLKLSLDMKAMSQALNFGKSVSDNGWGMFTVFLKYKLEDMGKQLVKIDKFFASSQICFICGYKNSETKNLAIREWDCPHCGTHHNRDVNAAINIRNEGMRLVTA